MAELATLLATGSFTLGNTSTSSPGYMWFNSGSMKLEYSWCGAAWSAGGALITARHGLAGAGEQNAGLAFGGEADFSSTSCTEEYNGSSWSAGGALITGRCNLAGAGTQNAGLAFGGYPALSCTEEYVSGNQICTL